MHILMLGNFGVFSFLRSWKVTRFLSTCISETSFKIWTFSAFLYIAETTRTNFFKISSNNFHRVYNKVWHFHRDWFTDIWYLRPAFLNTVGQILAWKVDQWEIQCALVKLLRESSKLLFLWRFSKTKDK